MKLLMVIGTRPEAIKMLPLYKACLKDEFLDIKLVVTGQHREMLDQVLEVFDVRPDYDLNIMEMNQTLYSITIKILTKLELVLKEEQPDYLLVHGDTTTTFASSLAAFYQQIKVAHVEAGLRTFHKYSPFPEEMNRKLVDGIADLFFCPTQETKFNLMAENIPEEKIFITGNTAIDALEYTLSPVKKRQMNEPKRKILITMHRRENLGAPMEQVFRAISAFSKENPEFEFYFPVHRNPRIVKLADRYFRNDPLFHLTKPLDVKEFHNLMAECYLILTDSGGIQEEAPSLNVPVLVLRETTERDEGVKTGALKLIGTDEDKVYRELTHLLEEKETYEKMTEAVNPYGDGKASERIVEILKYIHGFSYEKPSIFEYAR
ncbi:UDP-N-acetylglucosamine 2-epimerase [Enterococcus faecium EnGen0263]|uniref:non-hydrolyzing UDP-N-acetylglucosamine 2-epimerase n=1 Tax=Enterococcus faecium TaxID=1352 RepID=UPI000330C61F|nr:UDP-N-acetylglucosamine 2-epimerase (non-hydrolyzing) [Enterococcus faecium]EOH52852.1 UDP-N-acetylglucosamine 2-epimerase [Enterococcus faecium EnGen0263]